MRSILLALLLGVLTPALGWAQDPASLNSITGVTVNGSSVEITGTKKPNFTTFTMTEPPRLVIDISEASLSGVKDIIPVGNGTITAIQTANYGSEEAAIARVLIIYAREVETDIQARGNALVVGISGGAGVTVAARTPAAAGPPVTAPPVQGPPAAGPPAAGTASTGTGPAVAVAEPSSGKTPEQAAVAAREDRKRQEAEAEEARKAALAEQKRQEVAAEESRKAALAEQKRQEAASEESRKAALAEQKRQERAAEAEARKTAQAQAEAQARAETERKAREEATRVAAQQAERQRLQQEREAQLAQKQRQQEEARTAAEERKRLALEERQQRAAEEKTRREAAAQAAAETRKQQQDEARAAAEEKKRLEAEERERQRAEAQAAAGSRPRPREEERPTRVAQVEVPRPAPTPVPAPTSGEALSVSGRRKTMTLVGFKQEGTGSRVFVRTNEPVRYTVSEANKTVVVELENTRIGDEKNARMLDTSFFDTAVSLVDATYSSPARTTVRVAIKLKQQVPYQTHQEGNVLSIEFGRPTPR